jgi:LmbE family N-acetylglucosaminyl deacetylase
MTAGAPTRIAACILWSPGALAPVLALASLLACGPGRAEEAGQVPAIVQQLRTFANTGTVLHVAAHPDDENTQLITAMARGRGYRTAYLSVTRGDGGQNERGPDFAEKLGVLRTQELIAARKLDGGRQFFTRAIDYGYSKSPEEALRIWDHQAVLGDVVRVIRTFRPDVIITRFPIPPGSGGHGQHTASSMLAVEAFRLAADPSAYPEQIKEGLQPWQAKRIGWNGWGNNPSPLKGPTIQFDIGGADPVTGVPFGTIANQSRGMHKTQMLGVFSERVGSPGQNFQNFQLLDGEPATSDIMDGVDTTWARIPGGAALIPLIDDVLAKFNPADPAASVPALLNLRDQLGSDQLGNTSTHHLIEEKWLELDAIIKECLGLKFETTVPRAEVVAGEAIEFTQSVSVNRSSVPVRWLGVRYPDMRFEYSVGEELKAGTPLTRSFRRTLPDHLSISHPYWLEVEPTGGLFHVEDPAHIGLPENPPVLDVIYQFEIGGRPFWLFSEPVHLVAGVPEAQQRRRLAVIPPVSLGFAHDLELFAPGATKEVTVEVSAARAASRGSLQLAAPAGWTITPAKRSFELAQAGDQAALRFSVTAPATAGRASLAATAEVGGATYGTERLVLDYPHLPLQLLQRPAHTHLVAVDAQIRGKRVGYLPGAGDSTAESLAQLGYEVVTLTGADLNPAKLAGLDAVVLGVRASNDRDDLAANLPGLFAWVEAGGTVIAQYNRPNNLKASALGPYELSIEGPAPRLRVTDEDAPVTFLAPDHPVLNMPNKITAADFAGWVQERGAYFPSKWDEARYTAVLAMNDPGEAPLRSSLLVAQHGKGWFAYTGLSFFRQLPAGHPGAHRLFANLVSLGK